MNLKQNLLAAGMSLATVAVGFRQPAVHPPGPCLPGQPGTTSVTDTNAATAPRLLYRVGVP